jgi:hypothetical protein
MKRSTVITTVMALAIGIQSPLAAQGRPTLHIDPRWKECSFHLSPSLNQQAWRQFNKEAAMVVYFRPLADARPLGKRNFELSLVQWETNIDDADAAWNDTFVHPDSTHWLFEGDGLKFPGLMMRAGVTDKTDVGIYLTKAPGANYGFYGAQLQRSLAGGATSAWAAAARASFVSLYGPDDLEFSVYGADVIASRTFAVSRRVSLSPYAGFSSFLARAQEKSALVDLDDDNSFGVQGMVGAAVQFSKARLSAEYSAAQLRTISLKMGVGL